MNKRRVNSFPTQNVHHQLLHKTDRGESLALRLLPPSQDEIVDMLLTITLGRQLATPWASNWRGQDPQAFARILTPLFQKTCSLGLWPLRWKGGNVISLLLRFCLRSCASQVAPSWSVSGLGSSLFFFSGARLSQCMKVSCTTASREVAGVGGLTLQLIPRSSFSLVPSGEGSVLVACSLTSLQHFTLWSGSVPLVATAPRSCAEPLRALGLCQEAVRDPLRFRRDHGSILQKAGMQGATIKLLREYHTDMWVSQEGLADITHVVRATIAGNPLGDLIFGFFFTHVVQEVRAQLLSEGIYWTVPFDPEAPWLTPQPPEPQPLQAVDGEMHHTWMTRLCNFMHSDPQQWVTRATQIYNQPCSRYGLTLNFAPGKSEAPLSHVNRRRLILRWARTARSLSCGSTCTWAPCALTQILACLTSESAANPQLMPSWSLLGPFTRVLPFLVSTAFAVRHPWSSLGSWVMVMFGILCPTGLSTP